MHCESSLLYMACAELVAVTAINGILILSVILSLLQQ
jgi:hypothetical protein